MCESVITDKFWFPKALIIYNIFYKMMEIQEEKKYNFLSEDQT